MLDFLPGAGWIAAGGAIAAAGPIIIHLLNRRRFKVVHWGAMHLLKEAVKRNRRILELRDLILLALRTLCILLIGLALAGPYFSCSSKDVQPHQPVHAILIIDNGTSMAYDQSGESLLSVAKLKAKEYVDKLPAHSRVSVIPLCGPEGDYEPISTLADAKSAIDKLEVVDRMGSVTRIVELARASGEQAPDLPTKRVVFVSDMLVEKWPKSIPAGSFEKISELQLVPVRHIDPEHRQQKLPVENTWIDKFEVLDNFADADSPATFIASIRHQGPGERKDVDVKLKLEFPDGSVTEQNQKKDIAPNSVGLEVSFTAQLPVTPQEGRPVYVGATVSLPEDFLSADNHLHLSVPVLARVPVLFIDQYGKDENFKQGKVGETQPLRKLLAPKTSRTDTGPQLITVKRLKIDEVTQDQLRDARMVVIAGVERPDRIVPDLRDYVRQGGQLVIATGGDFDWTAWNELAWRDGEGILPVPLQSPIGKTPEEAPREVSTFTLDFDTLSKDWFYIPGESRDYLSKMYSTMHFFKAVGADVSDESIGKLLTAEQGRQEKLRTEESALKEKIAALTRKKNEAGFSVEAQAELSNAQTQLANLMPHWLEYGNGAESDPGQSLESALEQSRPRVLARFANGVPYAVERNIGQGTVLLLTSGIASGWNMVNVTNDMVMYERLLRPRLRGSLPNRTFSTDSTDKFALPISAAERSGRMELQRPGVSATETIKAESLGANESGVIVRQLKCRGLYWIYTYPQETAASATGDKPKPLSAVPIAVNGPAWEKGLEPASAAELKSRFAQSKNITVVDGDAGETATVAGAEMWAQNLWWILTLAVLILLAVEMLVLAWPAIKMQGAAT